MRTEHDLRAALQSLERLAPDLAAVLPGAEQARRGFRGPRRRASASPPPGSRRWSRLSVPVLTALAVVAAIVIPLTVGKLIKERAQTPGGLQGSSASARDFLIREADRIAALPADVPGKYWRVTDALVQVGAYGGNAHPYAMKLQVSPSTQWLSVSAKAHSWTIDLAPRYSTTPVTPGAAAAWRAAGSPKYQSGTARPSALWYAGGTVGILGSKDLTLAQFNALPTTGNGLAAVMRQIYGGERLGGSISLTDRIQDYCMQLLKLDPISPALRAATFRVLATMPGLRIVDQVTDPLGRAGYGIQFPMEKPAPGVQQAEVPIRMFVMDPATGRMLADENLQSALPVSLTAPPASGAVPGRPRPGTSAAVQPILALPVGSVTSYEVVYQSGWTNDAPVLPPPADRRPLG